MRKFRTVDVTAKDIEKAKRGGQGDSYNCIVAQAIARTFPGASRIDVDTQSIRFTEDGKRLAYLTPYQVVGYVVAFDAGEEIQPFSFRLYDERSLTIRRRLKTPAGHAVHSAHERSMRAKKKAERVAAAAASGEGDVTSDQVEAAREAAAAAAAEKANVSAAYSEATKRVQVDKGDRDHRPRVFKTKRRTYGHRVLRINQQENLDPAAD